MVDIDSEETLVFVVWLGLAILALWLLGYWANAVSESLKRGWPDWLIQTLNTAFNFAPIAQELPPPRSDEFQSPEEFALARENHEQLVSRSKELHNQNSKSIRLSLLMLASTCLFCVITLAGTPDAEMLTPESQVTLPFLNYPMDFAAFLVVGPALLIGITFYLHVFVAQHRIHDIPANERQPMLFNITSVTARTISFVLFYWMVPITLAIFAFKAWPLPYGTIYVAVALLVTFVLVILQVRRTSSASRLRAIPILALCPSSLQLVL